ncbi:MAG: hypothetical protein KDC07_02710 [Chitinophagaceae bacterium]|nr:hypothetical protein [Chitinophagaceae bacterium]MCB9047126.1 hypothetical protein [Chitinophagales bacterium]
MNEHDIFLIIIFTTLIILLLIAGIAIIIIIANRQRVKREVEFEKELRAVEQEVQEQLLTNVSQELHDNIGQMLTVMHLQLKKGQVKHPEVSPLLQPVSETLNDTIEQVKTLARGLNSDMVQDNGLRNNIAQETERLKKLEKFGLVRVDDGTDIHLSKDMQLLVFRVFQEMMNNVMKHSGATEVQIRLNGSPFLLEVRDNGHGFDTEGPIGKGMGLSNIQKRAKLAGLTCKIVSSVGKGCIFMLKQL